MFVCGAGSLSALWRTPHALFFPTVDLFKVLFLPIASLHFWCPLVATGSLVDAASIWRQIHQIICEDELHSIFFVVVDVGTGVTVTTKM